MNKLVEEYSHIDAVAKESRGKSLSELVGPLFDSVDSQKNRELAVERFGITSDDETVDPAERVTDEQLDEIEAEQVKNALRPFHQPKLRAVLLRPEHQVIDEVPRDSLLSAGYDPQAKEKAQSLISDFRQFIEDNKDEIEAISILYRRPYAAGLRYSHIKDLTRRMSIGPFHDALASLVDESQPQTLLKLWQAFGAVHPDKVDNIRSLNVAVHPTIKADAIIEFTAKLLDASERLESTSSTKALRGARIQQSISKSTFEGNLMEAIA